MYELLYTSVASRKFSNSELIDLLEESREKNERIGVTGMLIYQNNEFMQLLEGNKDVVEQLYQSIEVDTRHVSVAVFYEGDIDKRAFWGWSMAFKILDDSINQLIPGYESLDDDMSLKNLILENPNAGKKFFLDLRDSL